MENSKTGGDESKTTATNTTNEEESPNNQAVTVQDEEGSGGGAGSMAAANQQNRQASSRTPFTNLSQVDADLALARTLQEQERAYMMLRMNGGSDYGSWEAGSYVHEHNDDDDDDFDVPSEDGYDGTDVDDDDDDEEDAFDVHAHAEADEDSSSDVELDPSAFQSDEAYARALQDAEDREIAARLLSLAGITDLTAEESDDTEDHGDNSQDTWEEVDPDELSYEELLALGEVVGTESRGLSADSIASLPSINYKAQDTQSGSDSCVICRVDYEDGDNLTVLSCKHLYHTECINNWLQIKKVCPVCSAEVSTSGNSQ